MKFKNQIFLLSLSCLNLCGCSPTLPVTVDEEIDYGQKIILTGNEYDKLSYLLEGVIDLENDLPDTWNKPLSTDEQKGNFIFNILNNNYMDKYENHEEAPEKPHYPILQDSFIPNDGDVHDGVFPIDEDVKVVYKKSDIDQILNDVIGDTLKDGSKIKQDGMILSGNEYLLFTYKYYGSDLIGNKGRATRFEIDSINQASEKDIEVKARYLDDALEDGTNYKESECNFTYHISKNQGTFYGYTVNEYMYTGCKIDPYYIAPDLPSQMVYGMDVGLYSDYVSIKRDFKIDVERIDLDNDGVKEYFAIGPDSPNGTKIVWVIGGVGYNFIYDFNHEIIDDYNKLLDGLFAEIYFEDLDGDGVKEIIVAIGDKKTWVEAIEYKLKFNPNILSDGKPFEEIGHFYGKSYLEYDNETQILHAPYSDNGVCKTYDLSNDRHYQR